MMLSGSGRPTFAQLMQEPAVKPDDWLAASDAGRLKSAASHLQD
jgi:hypothetical protein